MLSNLRIITFILFVSASYSQSNLFKSHPYATLGTSEALTASASFGDIDGDGDLDIIVANGRHWSEQNEVFYNDGKGLRIKSLKMTVKEILFLIIILVKKNQILEVYVLLI